MTLKKLIQQLKDLRWELKSCLVNHTTLKSDSFGLTPTNTNLSQSLPEET